MFPRRLWFALVLSFSLIAVVLGVGAVFGFIFDLVMAGFHLFPWHTSLAIIIIWLWIANRMLADEQD
jgi:hypothetical protein